MTLKDTKFCTPLISCVILAYTRSLIDNERTNRCIETLLLSSSENFNLEIILVESGNIERFGEYKNVDRTIIYDCTIFNFHHALNLGLQSANGSYIAFCNNDLIFNHRWLDQIFRLFQNTNFKAASPVDPMDSKLWMYDLKGLDHIEGYEIQKYFKGWCFVVDRVVFEKIKLFDESFDFYYADNDFLLELKRYGYKHAAVLDSQVHHLAKPSLSVEKNMEVLLDKFNKYRSKIPKYVLLENRYWCLQNEKMILGLIQFHNKWGSHRTLKVKFIIINFFNKKGVRFFNQYILKPL